ncbi:glutathione ABC transporter substrate-binding protein [Spirochaetia bacterium]|nr:glutathione ABC transporter substrate-binding protein [Spirochaetia bacterium]
MRKASLKILLLLCIVAFFVGCTKKEAAGVQTQDRDLIIATAQEPTHFVSLTATTSSDFDQMVIFAVQDTLLKKDWEHGGEVIPYLAESYEVSPDGKQIKIKIRDNVYFHDGTKLTAEDFRWTYDETLRFPIAPVLWINYDHTEVVDDLNFIIHLSNPYAPFLNILCSRVGPVMSKAYWEKVGDEGYAQKPIGTGPYKFVEVLSGNQIVLERNDNYWGEKPEFKRVIIKTTPDVNTQIMAIETGDADVAVGVPIDNLLSINNPDVVWDSTAANTTAMLWFNMMDDRPLIQDINFRKAVQYAINKDAINQGIYGGNATMIDIYGDIKFSGRPPAGTYSTYEYNQTKAKEYLAKSSYKPGQEFRVITWAGNVTEKIAQIIQGNLQEVGINMRLVATDTATFYDTLRNTGNWDAQYWTTGSSIMDMDSLGNSFLYSRYEPKFKDHIKYPQGERLDYLCRTGRVEPDPAKRIEIYREAVSIVNDEAYQIYTHVDVNTVLYRKGLKGIKADMVKFYRYQEWSY